MEIIGPVSVKPKVLLFFCLFCFCAEILGDTKVGTIDLTRHKRNPQNDQHPNGRYFDQNAFRQNGTFEIVRKRTKNPVGGTATATRRDDESLNTQCTTPRKGVTVGAQSERECAKHYDQFSPKLTFHVFGGRMAGKGQFPYMAAVGSPLAGDSNQLNWYCGGSVLTDQWVLTAAHCVNASVQMFVRLGSNSLNGTGAVERAVKRAVKHHDYTTAYDYNDIALLELEQPVPSFALSGIRPICLHTNQSDIDEGSTVTVAGWGQVSDISFKGSMDLLFTNITTVSPSVCNASFVSLYGSLINTSSTPKGIWEGHLCAIDERSYADTCKGDSGGPLLQVNEFDVPILYGVTSFGVLCASNYPGVYTRVSHYLDWIECIIWG